MADARDSKSLEGNFMWVRLPPPAPSAKTAFCSFFNKYRGVEPTWVRHGFPENACIFRVRFPPPAPSAKTAFCSFFNKI